MLARPLGHCSKERLRAVSMILSDMDGTWLNPSHRSSPGGEEAIAAARASGLTFCFATGRCPLSAQLASKQDLSKQPGIYSNGAVVMGAEGAELYTLDLPMDTVNDLMDLGDASGVAVLTTDVNDFYITEAHLLRPYALHLHEVNWLAIII